MQYKRVEMLIKTGYYCLHILFIKVFIGFHCSDHMFWVWFPPMLNLIQLYVIKFVSDLLVVFSWNSSVLGQYKWNIAEFFSTSITIIFCLFCTKTTINLLISLMAMSWWNCLYMHRWLCSHLCYLFIILVVHFAIYYCS